MGTTKKERKTDESSLPKRHKQAREFTRDFVEELLSSTDKSSSEK